LQGICAGFRKIEGYLRSGKTYFVVAVAAHMGGANGVLALLRHRGYRIEQLSFSPAAFKLSRYYRFGPAACFSSHEIYHQSQHRNIMELTKNNRPVIANRADDEGPHKG